MTTLPPPGWYPDPTAHGPAPKRWWDGSTWTAHLEGAIPMIATPIVTAPEAVAVPAAPIASERRDYVSRFGETATFSEVAAAPYTFVPSRSGTASVWLIALTPIVSLLWTTLIVVTFVVTQSAFLPSIVALAWPLATLAWAVRDNRLLGFHGFTRPAHWAWMFLGPLAYLIARYVRTRREAGIGKGPLVTYLSINAGFFGLSFAAMLLAPTLLAPFSATFAEEDIREQLGRTGIMYAVECPETANYTDTATPVTCTVINSETEATGTVRVTYTGTSVAPYRYSEPVFD